MSPLRALRSADDRVVPYAAGRLRSALGTGRPRGPRPRGRLRRLDDRFARRGVPQLVALALTAVLVAGGGLALSGGGLVAPGGGPATLRPTERVVLGPEVGTRVDDYVAAARARAVELSREQPDAEHVALVSFEGYARPEQAQAALGDLQVLRAYLRVAGQLPSELFAPDVQEFVPDLQRLYRATADRKQEDARELAQLASTFGPDQSALREQYLERSRLAAREARAYGEECGCVFAVVVRATAATLAPLPAMEGFRVVDLAPRGVALEDVAQVRPLLPEQTDVVAPPPAPPRPGG